jgi:hypothetical protein
MISQLYRGCCEARIHDCAVEQRLGQTEQQISVILIKHLPARRGVRRDNVDIAVDGCSSEPPTTPATGNLSRRAKVDGDQGIVASWSVERAARIFAQLKGYALSGNSVSQYLR